MFRFIYLAWRDLRHYRFRTGLAILGIGTVVMVYLVLAGTAEGMSNIFSNTGAHTNLIIADSTSIVHDTAVVDPTLVSQAEALDGVQIVVPILYRHMRVGDSVLHVRANPLDTYRQAHRTTLVDGNWMQTSNELMIGEGLAKVEGWQVGQSLDVAGESFTVSGIFKADGAKNSEIWLALTDGIRVLNRPNSYSMILVVTNDEADAKAVYRQLKALLPPEAKVLHEDDFFEQSNQSLLQVRSVALLVSAIALIAIGFGVFNVASMNVAEKRSAISLLKVVGVSPHQILSLFVWQGVVLALVGFGLGLVVGWGVLLALTRFSAISLVDNAIEPRLTGRIILLGLGFTLGLSAIGAYFPARTASQANIIETLRSL